MGATKDVHNGQSVRQRIDSNGTNTTSDLKSTVFERGINAIKDSIVRAKNNHTEQSLKNSIDNTWRVCRFSELPAWLQDNDFLLDGHRPPLPSFRVCFQSIFRIHTETGNIWTHMLGCFGFICIAVYFLNWSTYGVKGQDKIVFGVLFFGAIFCLGFSFVFHALCCHSHQVSIALSKLDYFGISLLTTCSSSAWIYYGFYCHSYLKLFYIVAECTIGLITALVSLMDKFSESDWRPFRAGVFISFGLLSVLPTVHYGFLEGWFNSVSQRSLSKILLMAICYFVGACLYAVRVPERFYPGKFDLWFHSHQIFHVFVVCAALVHYHGVTELAIHHLTVDQCKMDYLM